MRTADEIIKELESLDIRNQTVLNAPKWESLGLELELTLAVEHEKMEDLRQAVNKELDKIIEAQEKKNVAWAQIKIAATDLHREMKRQDRFVERIENLVNQCRTNSYSAKGY